MFGSRRPEHAGKQFGPVLRVQVEQDTFCLHLCWVYLSSSESSS